MISPHSPKITYGKIGDHYKQKRICKRELPDQRSLEIKYDDRGRVHELHSPAGEGNVLVATHTFGYFKNEHDYEAHAQTALGGIRERRHGILMIVMVV